MSNRVIIITIFWKYYIMVLMFPSYFKHQYDDKIEIYKIQCIIISNNLEVSLSIKFYMDKAFKYH